MALRRYLCVLILVLVEIGLGAAAVSEANEPQVLNVLILVLVEIGLGDYEYFSTASTEIIVS